MAMRFERRQDEDGVTLVYRPWAGGEPVELRCERELPERMLAERAGNGPTSEKQRRRRRRRVVVGTCLLGVLICLGLGIWYMVWSHQSSDYGYWDGDYPPYGEDYYWDTGEFSQLETTIERYPNGDDVRLTLVADHAAEPLTAGEVYEKVNPAVVTVLGEQGPTYSVGTRGDLQRGRLHYYQLPRDLRMQRLCGVGHGQLRRGHGVRGQAGGL